MEVLKNLFSLVAKFWVSPFPKKYKIEFKEFPLEFNVEMFRTLKMLKRNRVIRKFHQKILLYMYLFIIKNFIESVTNKWAFETSIKNQ